MNPAMKKILYPLIIFVAGFSFTGCDDLLDITPKNKTTPDSFFSNEKELKAFSMNFYTMFPTTGIYLANDDVYTQYTLSDEIRGGNVRSIAASASDGGWSWGALVTVNTMLDNLGNCSDEQIRTRYEALARFFRAYFYFEKVKRFGEVPWYDSQVSASDTERLNRPRDSRDFIMGKMLEDIDFAIENLPSTKSAYDITKWTALALKSRFLLFEGTFRKYHPEFDYGADAHDYKWYLDLCAEASKTLMDSGKYSLHTEGGADKAYYQVFTTFNATDIMDEVILARNYSLTYSVVHSSNYTMNVGSMGRPGMTKKTVASYLMKDGSRFTDKDGWETMTFQEETQDRDPRLAQSIRTPGYTRLGDTLMVSPDFLASITGYQPVKYVTTTDQDRYNGSDIDLIIMRYAEVLLNYAEAKAEAETLTQDDLDISINVIRDRVGMPHLSLEDANANPDPFLTNADWAGYRNVTGTNEGVILEIRRERTIELAQEGLRYYDIMRWKEGKIFEAPFYGMYFPGPGEYDLDGNGSMDLLLYEGDDTPASTAPVKYRLGSDIILSGGTHGYVSPHETTERTWNEERDYLYPIPLDERSLTSGKLTQNPGWNDGLSF